MSIIRALDFSQPQEVDPDVDVEIISTPPNKRKAEDKVEVTIFVPVCTISGYEADNVFTAVLDVCTSAEQAFQNIKQGIICWYKRNYLKYFDEDEKEWDQLHSDAQQFLTIIKELDVFEEDKFQIGIRKAEDITNFYHIMYMVKKVQMTCLPEPCFNQSMSSHNTKQFEQSQFYQPRAN